MSLDIEAIRGRVAELGDWFHNMDLGGVMTAPDHFLYDYPNVKWSRFAHVLPSDMRGMSVLDIGCNAGFYALEMKRRGADRVLGIDSDPRYLAQARLAAEIKALDIEFRQLSVYRLADLHEAFDLVIFMGVLYHLRHPLLALDLIHDTVARDLMLFQTMQRGAVDAMQVEADYDFFETAHFDDPTYPRLHFIEQSYSADATNWWAPNAAGSQALLRSAGFAIVAHPEEEVYLCRKAARSIGDASAEPLAALRRDPGAAS